MRNRVSVFLFIVLLAASAHAQQWRVFGRGAAFLTHASETGPREPESRVFSTNWLIAGAERASGRSSILFRGRFTAETATVPDEGYPQLFQYVSAENGGPLVDHMRGHDAVEEVAVQLWWRALGLYAAPVGEPPLGATPYRQRASSIDFAEAPFAYDVQESFHVARRVVAAAIATDRFTVEGGVFHASHDDGDIDSWSARATVRPAPHVALQASHGSLGDAKQKVTNASLGYEGNVLAASAIWTRREPLTAYGFEAALRGARNTVMARVENVDRPAQRRMTHVVIGYVFDVWRQQQKRAGIGANVDYHTQTKSLPADYGHKPQSIYVFVRARTD